MIQVSSILPFHFLMLTIFGVWCPAHWPSLIKRLRKLYLTLVILAVHMLVILQLARLTFAQLSFDEFIDTFYIIIATGAACFKIDSSLVHYNDLLQLIDMFQEACCLARDDYERRLKSRYDDVCEKVGKSLLLIVEMTVCISLIIPLNGGFESRQLPFSIMQLHSLSIPLVYWLMYVHQVFAGLLCGGLNIMNDAMITGFLLQLCGQIDLVAYRLTNLPLQARRMYCNRDEATRIIVETTLLKENVEHHVHIYKIAEAITRTFNGVIVVQFYLSSLQICVSIYQLTTRVTNIVDMFNFGFFLICMFSTLGVYCYFGNELSVKSISLSDAIFNIDWTSLSASTQRNLAFMILRSSKPIENTDGAFVRLTMESFASIAKTSYTAFNVLKSS